jgi:hypothetical protein
MKQLRGAPPTAARKLCLCSLCSPCSCGSCTRWTATQKWLASLHIFPHVPCRAHTLAAAIAAFRNIAFGYVKRALVSTAIAFALLTALVWK